MTDAVNGTLIPILPAPSPDVAAEFYANEIMSNGSRRINNITGLLSDKQADHIKTQINLAFKAGWHAASVKGGEA